MTKTNRLRNAPQSKKNTIFAFVAECVQKSLAAIHVKDM